MPTYRPRYRRRSTAVLGPFLPRVVPPSPSPYIIARPPPDRPLSLYDDNPKNTQKPPLNRAPDQSVPTYRPTTTARPMGHSVRFMACPVGLPLPLFTGQPHTFSLPRLVRPIYRKVSRLAQLEPKGTRVTLFIRTCHGKKGLFTPCSFSCPNRKCPKTHEKSLVHVFANSQVVTTKRTPFRGGGQR